jgi:anthraniloyl-CoA monooxygenase
MANDPVRAVIRDEFAHWDDIEVHIHGETIRSSGTASSASAASGC